MKPYGWKGNALAADDRTLVPDTNPKRARRLSTKEIHALLDEGLELGRRLGERIERMRRVP